MQRFFHALASCSRYGLECCFMGFFYLGALRIVIFSFIRSHAQFDGFLVATLVTPTIINFRLAPASASLRLSESLEFIILSCVVQYSSLAQICTAALAYPDSLALNNVICDCRPSHAQNNKFQTRSCIRFASPDALAQNLLFYAVG